MICAYVTIKHTISKNRIEDNVDFLFHSDIIQIIEYQNVIHITFDTKQGYLDSNLIHYKELCVYGVHATTPAMMKQVLNLISNGNLKLKKYISRKYPLSEIEKGFVALRDEDAMKIVLSAN